MKTKSLLESNPYLKDAKQRAALIDRSVRTSCGVEGIKIKKNPVSHTQITNRKDKKIYKLLKPTDRLTS